MRFWGPSFQRSNTNARFGAQKRALFLFKNCFEFLLNVLARFTDVKLIRE